MARLLLLVVFISVASALPERSGKALSDLRASLRHEGEGIHDHHERDGHQERDGQHERYGHPSNDVIKVPGTHPDHPEGGDCFDISTYGPVLFNETTFKLKGYCCEKNCVTKTKEVCQSVDTVDCVLEGYADCKQELVETDYLHKDETETVVFTPHVCKAREIVVPTKEDETKCVEKPIWVCDSVWVPGPDGNLQEVENDKCDEETVTECEVVKKDVVKTYTTFDCEPAKPIKYVKPIYKSKRVNRYSSRCEAKALPKCRPKVETRCTTVTYQECTEEWTPTSNDIIQRIPYQDYDHRLKCIFD